MSEALNIDGRRGEGRGAGAERPGPEGQERER
jgi:hypothetical protein